MTPVIILQTNDAGRMSDLHAKAFPRLGAWDAKAFEDLLTLSTSLALGVEAGDILQGLILFQKIPPEAEILTLATSPEMQRQGIAAALLDAGMKLLGQGGITHLRLDVAEDNAPAIQFYRRHGFAEDARRKGYYRSYDGHRTDGILMSRLTAGQI